ncbi:cell division control protein 42 homolog isoform X2 [Dreissena polymorpha]|uniref:cell division control protein 42 homolog isoform X2 n=1 Tax=Dreissena polymorpha TaxID=45954 RepID=UPI00226439E8|nr:cell division control protein 42 homolog isoform X2 [Dreissena polymorpha]
MDTVKQVTVGVVGDSGVGKTLLCMSYTANHVLKDYKPTVLNHHWTLLKHDDLIVDLQIWDNSGSGEYNSLRPLSYPNTDVFLVCFSLKCLRSLENVRSTWLPEIEAAVGRRPFILVGCKRDDCVSGRKTLDVLTDEGEEMAQELGAVKYVETSAIEQSGFTTCFHSAIKAALDSQQTTNQSRGVLESRIRSRPSTTEVTSQTLKPHRSPLPARATSSVISSSLPPKVSLTKFLNSYSDWI